MTLFHSWDMSLFFWLNSFAGVRQWSDTLIIFRAEYLPYLVVVCMIAWYLCTLFGRFASSRAKVLETMIVAFSSAIVARFIIAEVIRFLYHRPRPFEASPFVHQLLPEASMNSFPSGHAVFFFALATGVMFYFPRTGLILLLVAVTNGLARVEAGVHWPSDIFGGALLGALTAWAGYACMRWYKKRYRNGV